SPTVRRRILQEQWPLGHILKDFSIPHASRPSAFLRIASDPLINSALGLTGAQVLFGRRNTLFNPSKRPLAEIVEILPPVKSKETVSPALPPSTKMERAWRIARL